MSVGIFLLSPSLSLSVVQKIGRRRRRKLVKTNESMKEKILKYLYNLIHIIIHGRVSQVVHVNVDNETKYKETH